jgi:hypothetical protein
MSNVADSGESLGCCWWFGVSRKGDWDVEAVFLSREGGNPGADMADIRAIMDWGEGGVGMLLPKRL